MQSPAASSASPATSPAAASHHWDDELLELLNELSQVQRDLLDVLSAKRQLLARADLDGMAAIAPRETELLARLQGCHNQRGDMLARARQAGLAGDSLRNLAGVSSAGGRGELRERFRLAESQGRLLQQDCLTNWMLAQRSLIHLSQMLEILATNGQTKPTYERGESRQGGNLLDQAV